jgi:hypothetical protein
LGAGEFARDTQFMNAKLLLVMFASIVVLFLSGCASPRVRQAGTSGSGDALMTDTENLVNVNDRSTWIDWPIGREF